MPRSLRSSRTSTTIPIPSLHTPTMFRRSHNPFPQPERITLNYHSRYPRSITRPYSHLPMISPRTNLNPRWHEVAVKRRIP